MFSNFRSNIQNNLFSASQRVASGNRINSARDDAAGLGIAQALEAQIRGLNQATQNTLNFDSLLNTAEGSLSNVGQSLVRIRELAIQASNDTLNTANRQALQLEIDQQLSHISSVAQGAQFNNLNLLDGSFENMNAQVGPNSGQGINVSIQEFSLAALGIEGFSVMNGRANIDIAAIDNALSMVTAQRGSIGALQNRMEYTANNNTLAALNSSQSHSRIADADIALEMMRLQQNRILEQMQMFSTRNQMERTRANAGFVGIMF